MKRVFDIVLSIIGIVLASPIMLTAAAAVRIDSPGPALYRGERVGRDGKLFNMLKFRTMVVDAERVGPSSTSADDSRITRIGRFLRRYKLDELSQLFNVLRGEMSFVGPRPQVKWAVDRYSDEERRLLSVLPGITDYASLVFRDEGEILKGSGDPNRDYFEKIAPAKNRLGLHYVRNHNLLTDLKLILATAGLLIGVDPEWALPPEERSKRINNRFK